MSTAPARARTRTRRVHISPLLALGLASLTSAAACAPYDGGLHRARLPSEIPRVTPERTRQLVGSGKALLVCAYADDLSFQAVGLHGAMSLQTFRRRHPEFPRDRLIIFYCN